MRSAPGAFILQYAWLILFLVVIGNLLYGRARAAKLVGTGRVSEDELSSFTRGAVVLFGGFFLFTFLVQTVVGDPDPFCLMRFPPIREAEWMLWCGQALLSGGIVYWLWARGGDDLLARLAPAFTQGPVLERTYSATRVRNFVTAVVIVAPVSNIVMQLLGGGAMLPACAAG